MTSPPITRRLCPPRRISWPLTLAFLAAASFLTPFAQADDAPVAVSFSREIAPLLVEHCLACHNARKAEGGYRVDSFAALATAGDSGLAPLTAEGDEPAELIRRITCSDEAERMPAETAPLDQAVVQLLTAWVAAGAPFDGSDPAILLPRLIPPPEHPAAPATYPAALPVTALAFSADGTQLYSSGYRELLVWNLDGTLAGRIGNLGERIYAIEPSPDGSQLAVACGRAGREGEVRLVSLSGEQAGRVTAVPVRCDDVVLDVAFRPDGRELAVASADKTIRIVDLESGSVTRSFQSHAEQVTAVSYSADGTRLASASRDGSAKVFDAASGQLLVSYQGHGSPVRGVALLPDGGQVISVGDDKKLHRWNVADAAKTAEVAIGGEGFGLARSETAVWVPSADRSLRRVLLADNAATTFAGHTDWVLAVAVSPDGSRVASGSHDGEIRLWNPTDATTTTTWQAWPGQ